MSGKDERPVKREEETVSRYEPDPVNAQLLHELIENLRNHGREERNYGMPAGWIIAELVICVSILLGGIAYYLITTDPVYLILVIFGMFMFAWAIEDWKQHIALERVRGRRFMEPPYPYMQRISGQEYEGWVKGENERNRRNA